MRLQRAHETLTEADEVDQEAFVTSKASGEIVRMSNSGKRKWIAPEIEIASARGANGSFSRSGSLDYNLYS
jgi:hypothetical protein